LKEKKQENFNDWVDTPDLKQQTKYKKFQRVFEENPGFSPFKEERL